MGTRGGLNKQEDRGYCTITKAINSCQKPAKNKSSLRADKSGCELREL